MDKDVSPVNAVFKGGGAKGVAYGGAVAAMEDQGFAFAAAAGSSAGALTAALLAAGYNSTELGELTASGLKSAIGWRAVVRARLRLGAVSARPLQRWLEEQLAAKIDARDPHVGVTFEDLRATGVDLFVVAMDLASRQPIVFNYRQTPHVSVSAAVVASCAIPLFFTPGRALVTTGAGASAIHALVDGGAWANFPDFIFCDPDFRAWYGLPATHLPTFGFVLNQPLRRSPAAVQAVLVSDVAAMNDDGLGSSRTGGPLTGVARIIGAGPLRLLLLFVLGLILALITNVMALTGPAISYRLQPHVGGATLPLTTISVATFAVAVAMLIPALLLLALFGGILFRSVLPSAVAALGPATGVAPWTGASGKLTLLSVPSGNASTLSFGLGRDDQKMIVDQARTAVAAQLGGTAPPALAEPPAPQRHILLFISCNVLIVALAIVAVLQLDNIRDALSATILLAVVTVAEISLLSAMAKRSLTDDGDIISAGQETGRMKGRVEICALTGAALLVLVVSIWRLSADLNETGRTTQAIIVAQQVIPGTNEVCYRIFVPSGAPAAGEELAGQCMSAAPRTLTFRSHERLRLDSEIGVIVNLRGEVTLIPFGGSSADIAYTLTATAGILVLWSQLSRFRRRREYRSLSGVAGRR